MYKKWRHDLIRVMGHVEAYLDFGDDEGIEADTITHAVTNVL